MDFDICMGSWRNPSYILGNAYNYLAEKFQTTLQLIPVAAVLLIIYENPELPQEIP